MVHRGDPPAASSPNGKKKRLSYMPSNPYRVVLRDPKEERPEDYEMEPPLAQQTTRRKSSLVKSLTSSKHKRKSKNKNKRDDDYLADLPRVITVSHEDESTMEDDDPLDYHDYSLRASSHSRNASHHSRTKQRKSTPYNMIFGGNNNSNNNNNNKAAQAKDDQQRKLKEETKKEEEIDLGGATTTKASRSTPYRMSFLGGSFKNLKENSFKNLKENTSKNRTAVPPSKDMDIEIGNLPKPANRSTPYRMSFVGSSNNQSKETSAAPNNDSNKKKTYQEAVTSNNKNKPKRTSTNNSKSSKTTTTSKTSSTLIEDPIDMRPPKRESRSTPYRKSIRKSLISKDKNLVENVKKESPPMNSSSHHSNGVQKSRMSLSSSSHHNQNHKDKTSGSPRRMSFLGRNKHNKETTTTSPTSHDTHYRVQTGERTKVRAS